MMIILWVLAFALLGYAIYRSTAVRQTMVQPNGQQVVYGEPQHGLILGLCMLAGICILSSVPLLLDRKGDVSLTERETLSKRTL